jgi:hypothetical protein
LSGYLDYDRIHLFPIRNVLINSLRSIDNKALPKHMTTGSTTIKNSFQVRRQYVESRHVECGFPAKRSFFRTVGRD